MHKAIKKVLVQLSLFLLKNNGNVSVILLLSISQRRFFTFSSTISGSKPTITTLNQRKSKKKGGRILAYITNKSKGVGLASGMAKSRCSHVFRNLYIIRFSLLSCWLHPQSRWGKVAFGCSKLITYPLSHSKEKESRPHSQSLQQSPRDNSLETTDPNQGMW